MEVRFGNLTVHQFAEIVTGEFTDDEIAVLESFRTDVASFTDESKFHIFEHPLLIVTGAKAFRVIGDVFKAADARRTFSRPVSFYPATNQPTVLQES